MKVTPPTNMSGLREVPIILVCFILKTVLPTLSFGEEDSVTCRNIAQYLSIPLRELRCFLVAGFWWMTGELSVTCW
jgi:hypothetical protein